VISGVRWDIFPFSLPLERGMEEVFLRGGRDFSKGSFLSAMGREV